MRQASETFETRWFRTQGFAAQVWAGCRPWCAARAGRTTSSYGVGATAVAIREDRVFVDGAYEYVVKDARVESAKPWLAILEEADTPAIKVRHILNVDKARPLVAAVLGPSGRPSSVALLSVSCGARGSTESGGSCRRLAIWSCVTPFALRRQGHARRLSAAVRAHAAEFDCADVHAFPDSPASQDALKRLGFVDVTKPIGDAPGPVPGLIDLTAPAATPLEGSG